MPVFFRFSLYFVAIVVKYPAFRGPCRHLLRALTEQSSGMPGSINRSCKARGHIKMGVQYSQREVGA